MTNKFMIKLSRGLPRRINAGQRGQASMNHQRPPRPKTRGKRLTVVFCAAVAAAGVLLTAPTVPAQSYVSHHGLSGEFDKAGNILIADQFNNRVIRELVISN